jgi:hypothetical protein
MNVEKNGLLKPLIKELENKIISLTSNDEFCQHKLKVDFNNNFTTEAEFMYINNVMIQHLNVVLGNISVEPDNVDYLNQYWGKVIRDYTTQLTYFNYTDSTNPLENIRQKWDFKAYQRILIYMDKLKEKYEDDKDRMFGDKE